MKLTDVINKAIESEILLFVRTDKMISKSAFTHNNECICIDPKKKSIHKTNPRIDFVYNLTFADFARDDWNISETCPVVKDTKQDYNPNARWGY